MKREERGGHGYLAFDEARRGLFIRKRGDRTSNLRAVSESKDKS